MQARKLVDGAKSLRIFGEEVPVRASVHTMGGFSAHADQKGLLEWYEVMAPSRPRTILTHGQDRARNVLQIPVCVVNSEEAVAIIRAHKDTRAAAQAV